MSTAALPDLPEDVERFELVGPDGEPLAAVWEVHGNVMGLLWDDTKQSYVLHHRSFLTSAQARDALGRLAPRRGTWYVHFGA